MNAHCDCERQPQLKIAWTDSNPGRRFLSCPNYEKRNACQFFAWYYPPMCDRSRQIISGLLRKINGMEQELEKMRVIGKMRRIKFITALVCSWLLILILLL